MRATPTGALGLLATTATSPAQVRAQDGCDPDLSTPRECWHSCETEADITICEIIWCPEGINCSGVPWDAEAERFVLTVPTAEEDGPRVGDTRDHYADGRRARGRVTTRLYRALGVDARRRSELVIIVTPRLDPPTPDTR
jgi:hypothetical protein